LLIAYKPTSPRHALQYFVYRWTVQDEYSFFNPAFVFFDQYTICSNLGSVVVELQNCSVGKPSVARSAAFGWTFGKNPVSWNSSVFVQQLFHNGQNPP
jgi:hypothetical protein